MMVMAGHIAKRVFLLKTLRLMAVAILFQVILLLAQALMVVLTPATLEIPSPAPPVPIPPSLKPPPSVHPARPLTAPPILAGLITRPHAHPA